MNSKIEFFLMAAVTVLSCFIVVYLRLYFFKKQNVETAKFSQRVMTFVMDLGMFNFIALFVGIVRLVPTNFVEYLGPGQLPELGRMMKEPIRIYVANMQEYGGWYLWSDLRILEAWLIGICMVYYIVLEIVRNSGTIGRKNSETVLKYNDGKKDVLRIILRSIVKFTPLILATYWMGLLGVFIYTVVLYCIYRINKEGKMPHDFLANTVVKHSKYID